MRGITLLIGVVVGIVLISAVAIPIIGEATGKPAPNDDLYVFMLAGQSNSAYYNADVSVVNEEVAPITDGFSFYYGTESAPINCGVINNMQYDTTLESYGIYSMTNSDGTFRIGNIEAPFASDFVNKTNQKILIVNTGIGGVSINSYVPSTVGYEYAAKIFGDAISKIPEGLNPKLAGIIWIQGESDAALNVELYITQFGKMFDGFKTDLGLKKIYISETRPLNGGNASVAQTIIPDRISNAYLATDASADFSISGGPIANDTLHYTQKGDDILGRDLAEYVIDSMGLKTGLEGPVKSLIGLLPLLLVMGIVLGVVVMAYTRME